MGPDSTRFLGSRARGQTLISERQRQVLLLAESGASNREIALQLGYSEGTVRSELLRVSKALGVRGRDSLVELARHAGLLFEQPEATEVNESKVAGR
jgi:DNA-binding CsgD family transcriptional regulator